MKFVPLKGSPPIPTHKVCPRPTDNPYTPLLVDMTWHDSNLTRSRCNDAWTVGSNQTRLALSQQGVLNLDHVLLWNTFCDADY